MHDKLHEIFGSDVCISSMIISQHNTVFEVKLTDYDELWKTRTVLIKDLATALGLDPSEWTVLRKL